MSGWIKIDDNTFGREADPDPVEVVKLSELEAELAALQEELINYPLSPSDNELLEWAKNNHPYYIEKDGKETRIEELNQLIRELKQL